MSVRVSPRCDTHLGETSIHQGRLFHAAGPAHTECPAVEMTSGTRKDQVIAGCRAESSAS